MWRAKVSDWMGHRAKFVGRARSVFHKRVLFRAAICGLSVLGLGRPASADEGGSNDTRKTLVAMAPAGAGDGASATKGGKAVMEAAREKAAQGLAHFEAKRWAEAYAAFREADDLFHAPTLTLAMAECEEAMGHLLSARELYRKLLAEAVSDAAPEQFKGARVSAQNALNNLEKKIPTLSVTLLGANAERAEVFVDGTKVSVSELSAGVPLDPGEHVVTAKAPGGGQARLAVKVVESVATRTDLTLRVESQRPAPQPGSLVPAAVAYGLGGAGLTVGVLFGIVASGLSSEILAGCRTIEGEQHCRSADVGKKESATTFAVGSGVALGVGGALLATGIVLTLVRPGATRQPSGGAAESASDGHVEFRAGWGSVSVGGSF